MLCNVARHDSLEPRYYGPFEVIDRKRPDVKLHIKREVWDGTGKQRMRLRNKWIHLDSARK